MKLTVECLTRFSPQDKIDLAKIWPHQNIDLLEEELTPDRRLFAARFNDRLLGGMLVELEGEYAELSDLMVREVTRRRGVGKLLIDEARHQLPEVKEWWLATADHAAIKEEVLARFMVSCGFSPVSGGWRYIRRKETQLILDQLNPEKP
ncbi:aspartate 1-decarboxylase autocleavage activator PanM [Pectobacterium versatile]|uniref:aspartate 1-decarboxylase autocleavage activator PanM n=1 Tax=Pectobacterium versatile TaxID=2488639 RepID=UPI0015DF6664|nr:MULTISPECIES: aspartate 1-decarboxylase autocleavage activator PanM [Pectobacterium]MBA0165553.1 aspartate 1-decarboxylase autocleavage activator PanM [Pectobacterium versatile]MBD0846420.1 acetyltransferase [Pectobacterium carotovorum subsp. carotovorum]MBK4828136.1 PanD maturation factor [Pectobacterium carotovorum subsp. carotovorum]MBN3062349.1 aspartate 1-decarboxylase autocleavage activator PanM [Pectobacterium versatile]UNE79118.1 aspartate 1-decarboxylase autocleavage activator PanM